MQPITCVPIHLHHLVPVLSPLSWQTNECLSPSLQYYFIPFNSEILTSYFSHNAIPHFIINISSSNHGRRMETTSLPRARSMISSSFTNPTTTRMMMTYMQPSSWLATRLVWAKTLHISYTASQGCPACCQWSDFNACRMRYFWLMPANKKTQYYFLSLWMKHQILVFMNRFQSAFVW